MIKIKRNFFDNDLIDSLSSFAIKSYKSNKLRTNFSSWNDGIVQHSSVVLIYDIFHDNEIYKKLCKKFDTEDYNFTFQYWTQGSYIPWHDDGHTSFTATFYCNRYWNKDWGGLFLYEKDDNILAEVPEWNKLIVQTARDPHSTTSVTKPYWARFGIEERTKEIIQSIRTTIQIFEIEK